MSFVKTTYDKWTTKDGRTIPVTEMTDLHLLNVIKAIEEGRILPPTVEEAVLEDDGDGRFCFSTPQAMQAIMRHHAVRDNWLTVFRGEALRRGLNPDCKPIYRVGLVDWVIDQMTMVGFTREHLKTLAAKALEGAGIADPVLDINNLNGRPSYCHWTVQAGEGQPLPGGK